MYRTLNYELGTENSSKFSRISVQIENQPNVLSLVLFLEGLGENSTSTTMKNACVVSWRSTSSVRTMNTQELQIGNALQALWRENGV